MDKRGEELARRAFGEYLEGVGSSDAQWRQGREPPDYYLRVDDASFAVEVTRIMEMHDLDRGKPLSTHAVRAALERIPKLVERQARAADVLRGTYCMTLPMIPDLRRVRAQIIETSLEYIRQTQSAEEAPRVKFLRAPHGRFVAIQKVHSKTDKVYAAMLIGTARRSQQVREDLIRLVGATVERKERLLSRLRLPRILLLVDSYLFGEGEEWREAAARVDFGTFHTVARIADARSCQVLFSRGHRGGPPPNNEYLDSSRQ